MTTSQNLPELVPEQFKPLKPLENKLLEAAPLGQEASDFEPDEPIDMTQIGEGQTVRSELLIWLLTDSEVRESIHYKGINLRGARIQGILDLQDSTLEYPLRLRNCLIEGKLVLDRGQYTLLDFTGSHTGPITAKSINVKHDVIMNDRFGANGEVNLVGAVIGGDLDCIGGEFENPGGYAFNGNNLTTKGAVFLNEVKAKGEVNLLGATIGNDLKCEGGEFYNPNSYALFGQGLTTKGSVFLGDRFMAKGEVNLVSANIGRVLICSGGEFYNPDGYALNGRGLTTKGSVFLRNEFKAKGIVRFYGAEIGGDLNCQNSKFDNNSKECFVGNNVTIEGSFLWRKLMAKPNGIVNLDNAIISNLNDDGESWPETGNLSIDGLTYGPFSSGVPADAKSRLKWLNLRPSDDTSVQPYEQLISVFRQMGLEDDAREIAIAKQRFIRKNLQGISRLWSWILDITISYGYRPEKVIAWFIIPIVILGYFVFNWANSIGVMEFIGNDAITNPTFNPFIYSVDVFLPIINLSQQSSWSPISTADYGKYVQYFIYFQILAGWFFTTLAVAAVTGLVRRD